MQNKSNLIWIQSDGQTLTRGENEQQTFQKPFQKWTFLAFDQLHLPSVLDKTFILEGSNKQRK